MGYDSFAVAAIQTGQRPEGYNSVNIDGVDKEGTKLQGTVNSWIKMILFD
jgi:hypothetical protein